MGNHTATRARGRASGAGEPKAKTARPAKKASADEETKALRAARAAPTGPTGPTPREREAESRARAAESRATAAERRATQLERQLATLQAQHDALKARVAGGTTRRARAAESRATAFTNLVPVGPIDMSRLTPMHTDPYALAEGYGRRQAEGVLRNMGMEELRRGAGIVAQRNPGTAPASRSKRADLVDYIMAHLPATTPA